MSAMRRRKGNVADSDERKAFWTTVLRDRNEAMRNRLRASELLGKSCGDFVIQHEHAQKGAIQLTLNLGDGSVDPAALGW